jgi:hypothetical protein
MHLDRSDRQLVLKDSPGFYWIAASLFILVGFLGTVGPLGLYGNFASVPKYINVLSVFLGGGSILSGIYLLYCSPASKTVFDLRERRFDLERKSVFGRSAYHGQLDAIRDIRIAERNGTEGEPVYRVCLLLENKQTVWPSLLWVHDRMGCEQASIAIRDLLTQAGHRCRR